MRETFRRRYPFVKPLDAALQAERLIETEVRTRMEIACEAMRTLFRPLPTKSSPPQTNRSFPRRLCRLRGSR